MPDKIRVACGCACALLVAFGFLAPVVLGASGERPPGRLDSYVLEREGGVIATEPRTIDGLGAVP